MSLATPRVLVRLDDADIGSLIHISPCPYTHALCGTPRGDKPLKPTAEPTCVVCVELAGNR